MRKTAVSCVSFDEAQLHQGTFDNLFTCVYSEQNRHNTCDDDYAVFIIIT